MGGGTTKNKKNSFDKALPDPEKATQERSKLLRHPIFATAHEGTPKLGGVSKTEREELDRSQQQQLGQLGDKGVTAELVLRSNI